MAETHVHEVPHTLEGWYVLHDVYVVDWLSWRNLDEHTKMEIADEASHWLSDSAAYLKGDTAAYNVLTQKGDLMFLHYRETPDEIGRTELTLRQIRLYEYLVPVYSFLSVIEINMYELTSMVMTKLADQDIVPGTEEYDTAFETELSKQKNRLRDRLYCNIPGHRYICFYPMSKVRGEEVNWYILSITERRDIMRDRSRIVRKYQGHVDEIISGAIGLDDWEWAVSLHSDDIMTTKKLLQELRFDTADANYTQFGPIYIGIRCRGDHLPQLLGCESQ